MSLIASLEHRGLGSITAAGESKKHSGNEPNQFFVFEKNMSGTEKNSSDQNLPSKSRIDRSDGRDEQVRATKVLCRLKHWHFSEDYQIRC